MTDETKHLCPLRAGNPAAFRYPDGDTWDVRPNGDRSCSFCGSIHPDDLASVLPRVDGLDVALEINDRRDKVYIHRPEVSHAGVGPIKFKLAHLPEDDLFRRRLENALQLSRSKMHERAERAIKGLAP